MRRKLAVFIVMIIGAGLFFMPPAHTISAQSETPETNIPSGATLVCRNNSAEWYGGVYPGRYPDTLMEIFWDNESSTVLYLRMTSSVTLTIEPDLRHGVEISGTYELPSISYGNMPLTTTLLSATPAFDIDPALNIVTPDRQVIAGGWLNVKENETYQSIWKLTWNPGEKKAPFVYLSLRDLEDMFDPPINGFGWGAVCPVGANVQVPMPFKFGWKDQTSDQLLETIQFKPGDTRRLVMWMDSHWPSNISVQARMLLPEGILPPDTILVNGVETPASDMFDLNLLRKLQVGDELMIEVDVTFGDAEKYIFSGYAIPERDWQSVIYESVTATRGTSDTGTPDPACPCNTFIPFLGN